MRLINVKTLQLEEFVDEDSVEFAILSHRWGADEVSFQDMQNPSVRDSKAGFGKIFRGCVEAMRDGYNYFWCDTCCINKESTAELSEAINSMFRWYQLSSVCYVFMADVDAAAQDSEGQHTSKSHRQQDGHRSRPSAKSKKWIGRKSEWFRRGWTLQELIAPRYMKFYDCNWSYLGSRSSLVNAISRITGIEPKILDGESAEALYDCSVAQRMSWAAGRVTTRVEDMAYCLMGIFDINMPMLYGEGQKAFIRLQEEIIKQSDDHSIFCWPLKTQENESSSFADLLAKSPAAFAGCADVGELRSFASPSYSMTNRGLCITLYARPFTTHTSLALLNCAAHSELPDWERAHTAILLQHRGEDDQYLRISESQWSVEPLRLYYGSPNFDDTLKNMGFKQKTFYVKRKFSKKWQRSVADGVMVSLSTQQKLMKARMMPFRTGDALPSIHIGFDTLRFPIVRVRLLVDHDLHPVCVMEVCSQMLVSVHQGSTMRTCRVKDYSLLAPSTVELLNAFPPWETSVEDKIIRMEKGIWALKGDRDGKFEVFISPFGKIRLKTLFSDCFTKPGQDDRPRLGWDLNFLINERFVADDDTLWSF